MPQFNRSKKNRRRLREALGVGLLAVGIACVAGGSGNRAGAEESARPIQAESALLRVDQQVTTPARAAGLIAQIAVKEGDVVKKGDLLGHVDDVEAKLVYQRAALEHELAQKRAANEIKIRAAEKSLAFSRQELSRLQRAAENIPGSISLSELEEGKVKAEQAALNLEQARHDHSLEALNVRLKRTERLVAHRKRQIHKIEAPINGVVVEIMRRQGEWVEPGEDVIRIMRIDRLRVEGLVVVENIMPQLRGAPVQITVSAPGHADIVVGGRVVFVHPEINPVNRRVRVRAEIENPDGRLSPGLRVQMVIHPTVSSEEHSANADRPRVLE